MAFGLKYIEGAEEDKMASLKKDKDLFVADNYNEDASIVSSPQRTAIQKSAPQKQTSDVRAASLKDSDKQKSNLTGDANSNSGTRSFQSKFRSPNSKIVSRNDYSQEPAIRPPAKPVSSSIDFVSGDKEEHLALRARRIVQEVGDFKKWCLDEMIVAEKEAMADPDKAMETYLPIYKNEIKPHREKGCRSLDEAIKKHSNDVVFLLTKGSSQKLCVIPKDSAGAQSILHGSVLSSVPSKFTHFKKPSELFLNNELVDDKKMIKKEQVSEDCSSSKSSSSFKPKT